MTAVPVAIEPPPASLLPFPSAAPARDETVAALAHETVTLAAGAATGEDLDRLFKGDRDLDCVVVLSAGRPTHLVTREHYYARTGGRYGFTVFQKKPVELVAKADPLVVGETVPLRQLARLALARPRDDQYDPVIVTGAGGLVRGIVTIQQLVQRAAELELRIAQLSNPLTRLPGSPVVQEWIESGLATHRQTLSVVFVALDGFREHNEVYGLAAGDDLVRRTAQVLADALRLLGPEARLGHSGGDDFVIVCPQPVDSDALREICARFDREKLDLFQPADLERGYFDAHDDRGNPVRRPLTLLTLTVIGSGGLGAERHPAIFSQLAANLRRTARALTAALGRSSFVADLWPSDARC